MYVSHHSFSEAAIETSKAGKRRGRTFESTNPKRTRARTATVPVVRGTGTGEGWPPGIPKPSGLKGHDSTLPDKEAGGDEQRCRQSAPGKEDIRAVKVRKENR
jgi:hypothetical protein